MTSLMTIAAIGLLGAGLAGGQLQAAELSVIAGGAIPASLNELAKQFETATGHTLAIRYGTTPELIKMATSDTPFDVAIVPSEVFRDENARAKFVPGPTSDIARIAVGVAVRAGAAKPDIATAAALKQALLNTKSLATVPVSAGGAQVLRLFERLGIADEMKAKTKAATSPGQMIEMVEKGEAELGMFLANVFAVAPSMDLVGLVPEELRQEVVFTASVAAASAHVDACRALIAFLQTPAAKALFKQKGMTPS